MKSNLFVNLTYSKNFNVFTSIKNIKKKQEKEGETSIIGRFLGDKKIEYKEEMCQFLKGHERCSLFFYITRFSGRGTYEYDEALLTRCLLRKNTCCILLTQ